MDILSKQIVEPNLKVSVNAMEVFLEVVDKIKQTDTDIKILKEIIKNNGGKSFHNSTDINQVALNLDLSLSKSAELSLFTHAIALYILYPLIHI